MNKTLLTRSGLFWRTAKIAAISVGATLVVATLMILLLFGADLNAQVRLRDVLLLSVTMGSVIAAALSGCLSYRSGRLLQELMRAQAELLRIARTDTLTGLMNRRGFDETAGATLEEACAAGLPTVAFMCDIDHFKAINDRFGHDFGDAVLSQIAEVFRAFAEREDILVARHGGEEFAALVVGASIDEVALRAEHLRQMCAARRISHEGTSLHVTVSIGIAASQGETDLAKVMRVADEALYAAKRRGRNCVVRMEPSLWQLDLLDEDVPVSPDGDVFALAARPLREAAN